MITHERLLELLHYNPQTGAFTWRSKRRGRCKQGTQAGTKDREGYVVICVDGRHYRAHRLAWLYMTGEWPTQWLGHVNRVKADNRWSNLSLNANLHLKADYKNNTSGVRGVSWNEARKRWAAQIGKKKRAYFDRFEDAVRTRKLWERCHLCTLPSLRRISFAEFFPLDQMPDFLRANQRG